MATNLRNKWTVSAHKFIFGLCVCVFYERVKLCLEHKMPIQKNMWKPMILLRKASTSLLCHSKTSADEKTLTSCGFWNAGQQMSPLIYLTFFFAFSILALLLLDGSMSSALNYIRVFIYLHKWIGISKGGNITRQIDTLTNWLWYD